MQSQGAERTTSPDSKYSGSPYTSIRVAGSIRIIRQKNGGTFVGMHEAEGRVPRIT